MVYWFDGVWKYNDHEVTLRDVGSIGVGLQDQPLTLDHLQDSVADMLRPPIPGVNNPTIRPGYGRGYAEGLQ